VEVGFDAKSLSELLGHSTVSMTMDRYVHPTLEHKRENMQLLSGLLDIRTETAQMTAQTG
jgi:integrase